MDGVKHSCYGIVYDKRSILTVAHIFNDKYETENICAKVDINGQTYELPLIYIDFSLDLALLKYENDENSIIFGKIERTLFIQNNSFFAKSTNNSLVKNEVKNKPDTLIRLKIGVTDGSSGSAVLTKNGKIAGMICAKSPDGKFAYAVPSDKIIEFLKNYQNNSSIQS